MRVGLVIVVVIFQKLEVVDLLEWVEGEAKIYYQIATNLVVRVVEVEVLPLSYQMAKNLPFCF